MLRFGGVAAGVALILALGYLVLMEFLAPAGTALASGSDRRQAIIPGRERARVPVAARTSAGRAATLDKPDPPLNGSDGR